jgi:hypothetical protein
MLAYLAWRLGVEFIKPREIVVAGLSAIQIASLLGAIVCAGLLWNGRRIGERSIVAARSA